MKLRIKTTAAICALVLGLAFAGPVSAGSTATVTATLTAIGALSAANVNGMNFGTWLFVNPAASPNDIVLVKSPTTGAVANTDNGTGTSTVIGTPNTTRAEQTVQITGGTSAQDLTVVNVNRGAITNFTNTNAVLSDITFETFTEAPGTLAISPANSTITIVNGTLAESVYFGGTVTVAGDVTGTNTATFLVSYSY